MGLSAVAVGASCYFIDPFDEPVSDTTGSSSSSSSGEACTPFENVTCYPGPKGTLNVGLCKAGKKTCDESGVGFGPCVGAVVPTYQSCASKVDQDCDGETMCVGDLSTALGFGDGEHAQMGIAIAATNDGAAVLGSALGSIDFGDGPLEEMGNPAIVDIVIARFALDGSLMWQRRFPDANGTSIAFAENGDVLVTGSVFDGIDFGGGLLEGTDPSTPDVFFARFDAAGDHITSKRFSSPGKQLANVIAGFPGDIILIGGSFEGTFDLGQDTLTSAGGLDAFFLALEKDGSPILARRFGGAGDQEISSVSFNALQGLVIGGTFQGQLNLGGLTLTSAGGKDIFAAQFGKAGDHLWSRSFGGPNDDTLAGVVIDSSSIVTLAGAFSGSLVIDQMTFSTPSMEDILLVQLDVKGDVVRAVQRGGLTDSAQKASGIAVDQEGDVLLTGAFVGSLVFDEQQLVGAGSTDMFVAKLSPLFAPHWATAAGDALDQVGLAIAADPLGGAWVTGFFEGTMLVKGAPLTAKGSSRDMFVLHIGP